jgi:hypothetical protein
MSNTLDLYSDYLIVQNKYATSTGLSEMLNGTISHDKVTRLLNKEELNSKEPWKYIKSDVRNNENSEGMLILDDWIEEKSYTDENEIIYCHYSHAKSRQVKSINLLSYLVNYGDISLPIGYEIMHKNIKYSYIETKKVKWKAAITKNEHFCEILKQAYNNKVLFSWALVDNWFAAKENLEYIHYILKKNFIIGMKSNRNVILSEEGKAKGNFTKVSELDLEDGKSLKVWLRGIEFPMQLIKKVFIYEDASKGVLYLMLNDLIHDADYLYLIYQKRWSIEVYHKSIKQNASLAAYRTKRVLSQASHLFCSLISYCKLELLKIKTATNHFAMKHQLVLKVNQASYSELLRLQLSVAYKTSG